MKELLFLLLLSVCLDTSHGLYNYLGKMPVDSLSHQRCSVFFYGKDVSTELKKTLDQISILKKRLDNGPFLDKSSRLYALPSTGTYEEFPPAWILGHWPYIILSAAKDLSHECGSTGGHLPSASRKSLDDLVRLLKNANLTFQIIDAKWEAGSLISENLFAAKMDSLIDANNSPKASALNDVIVRHESIYSFDAETKAITILPKSKWDEKVKGICLIPINRYSRYLLSPTDYKVKTAKIKSKLTVLFNAIEAYWDRLKLTMLDLTQSNYGTEIEGYPIIIGQVQEFLSVFDSCFSLQQCNLYDEDVLVKIDSLLETIGYSLTRIELGFVVLNEATCSISNTVKLSCLCTDTSKTWVKLLFEPTPINNRLLSFDHLIYQTEGTKPVAETCMYESNHRHYVLTEKCCNLVLSVDAAAINSCPSIYLDNYSGVTLENKLLRIDATVPQTITTQCDQVKDSKVIVGADSLMLSSCNTEVLSKLGRTIWKGYQNFLVEKSLGENKETFTTKDIIIYSSLGAMSLCLVSISAGVVFYCSKKSNKVVCFCFKRKQRVMEPLQLPEVLPLRSYERSNLEHRPPIAYQY